MQNSTCNRVWLLYLQGRLSPVQLLALCKLPVKNSNESTKEIGPLLKIASDVE